MKKTDPALPRRNPTRGKLEVVQQVATQPTIPDYVLNLGATKPANYFGIIVLPMQYAHATNTHTKLAYGADVQRWLDERYSMPSSVLAYQTDSAATATIARRRQRLEEALLVSGCHQLKHAPLCIVALDLLQSPADLYMESGEALASYRRYKIPMLLLSLPAWRRAGTDPYSVEEVRKHCLSLTPHLEVTVDVSEEQKTSNH